ncbi:hypothetical protein [Marmoricola sp. URHA0025 HA25]
MQTVPCPHCSEPIRPTATFCLACDRVITDTERGLSVAEPVPASVGRPLVGLVVAAACVALLGGAAYGGVRIYRHAHVASADAARSDVRRGFRLLVSAESGQGRACDELAPVVAPPAPKTREECQAVLGEDRSAHLDTISVGTPHFGTGTGTVQVKATITDDGGTHAVDETVRLVEVGRHWRMAWDGKPAASRT